MNFCRPYKPVMNERGVLTLDFIFALTIVFGFTAVFFAVSVTLSMVEVTQYISFAAARTYAGAHENIRAQDALAHKKFAELMATPIFRGLYGLGWFTAGPLNVGNFNSLYQQPSDEDSDTFVGARIPIYAQMLRVRVPFLGSTATKAETGKATVSSYLSREVTTEECREQFNRARYKNLKALQVGGKAVYGALPTSTEALITDNGC
jgi:hypothetical protein